MTFAVNQIFLGDTDRNGNTDATSSTSYNGCSGYGHGTKWKAFGYDLDRNVTSKDATDVCTLGAGAPKTNQIDGDDGIDNAWGALLLGVAGANVSSDETTIIQSGAWTLLIQLDGVPTRDATGAHLRVFVGGTFGASAPAFDTTTDWPVLASSVVDGATIASGAVVEDDDAWMTSGTFVSAPTTDMPIELPLMLKDGTRLVGRIHRPVVTFSVSADATSLTGGTIAGVFDPSEFVATARSVAGLVSTNLCGSAFDGIAQQIMQDQDILSDETNHAGVACDAISIGIGFNARMVANPTKVVAEPNAPPDPCVIAPDAGVDASDASDGASE